MSSPALFPVWQEWAGCTVGRSFKRVLVSRSDSEQLVALLTILHDRAQVLLRWEARDGTMVCPISEPYRADGVTSVPRAMQWAEWVLSDLGQVVPRKAKRREVRAA